MKKQILNIGKTLDKKEQKQINGGARSECRGPRDCWLATGGVGSIDDYLCIDGHCAFNPF